MNCKKCNGMMYLKHRAPGSKTWACSKCGEEIHEIFEAFEPAIKMIDPTGFTTMDLAIKVKLGEFALSQIPLPERENVRQEIEK